MRKEQLSVNELTVNKIIASGTTMGVGPAVASSITSQVLGVGSFTDNTDTTGYIDIATQLPAGALVIGWKAVISGGFSGDTTATMQVGVSGTLDKFSVNTTTSCLTTGTVGCGAKLSASTYLATATTVRVTVTGAADFTAIKTAAVGSMVVTVYFIATQ